MTRLRGLPDEVLAQLLEQLSLADIVCFNQTSRERYYGQKVKGVPHTRNHLPRSLFLTHKYVSSSLGEQRQGDLSRDQSRRMTNLEVIVMLKAFKPLVLVMSDLPSVDHHVFIKAGDGLANMQVVAIDRCPQMLVRPIASVLPRGTDLWFGCSKYRDDSLATRRLKSTPIVCGIGAFVQCDNGCGGDAHDGIACVACGVLVCHSCLDGDEGTTFDRCSQCVRPVCSTCLYTAGHLAHPGYVCHVCAEP